VIYKEREKKLATKNRRLRFSWNYFFQNSDINISKNSEENEQAENQKNKAK